MAGLTDSDVLRCDLVQVYLYGGHVTSWKNDHGEELLFLSNKVCVCVCEYWNVFVFHLSLLVH